MLETFESDRYIFNNDISFLIESKNMGKVLKNLKEKHLQEEKNGQSIRNKKNDLIIWNAIYTKEIIKNGVSKSALHPLYNKFYDKIQIITKLEELQELEISMANSYFYILINDIQVTDNFTINKMLQYIHVNIENYLSLDKLSRDLNISAGYASNCFKKYMGISVMRYVQKTKIDRAKNLLLSTNKSILYIGILLGFYDQSHFSRTFKSIVGMSPTIYRNRNYS
ncbi:Helix-turn-helix domain-containing protein [Clostridium acidisoli DSM 12555]|uniref:Helix-turn-helix domain-containing protein n=1 Tax=Clostridium acidisoli DSM 12555 TaxID=1121291 RepID=A0A1W1XMJ4_9CLOT|nr:helix-turn-helix domain-containing protein [Clostridium acidisoli]SMC25074.1 Helix-turn-helix domain-containing protein [Clostridium acidisoli DSM 12555]